MEGRSAAAAASTAMRKDAQVNAEKNEPTFVVGTIVGFHGLEGEVKVRPQTNKPEVLLDITHVRTKPTKTLASMLLEVENVAVEKRLLWMQFKGYEDRTSVETLMGAQLLTWESQVGELEEEEFWIKDLIGAEVYTQAGNLVGKVADIIYGGSDLLEIKPDNDASGKMILIPFVRHLVPVVDLKANRIEVSDIPGLLEPQ